MTEGQIKVTIITVVRNDAAGLEKTICSVTGQNYPSLEYIIIDGGSGDGTLDVIRSHAGQIASWVSEPDRGIYDAMNKGLAKATGDWVNFLNAGDTFADGSTVPMLMATDLSDIDVVYGDTMTGSARNTFIKRAGSPEELGKGMILCHQSAFIRTGYVKNAGFDPRFSIGADYDQLMKLRSQGCRFLHVAFPVAHIDTTGISNTKMVRSAREHLAIATKYRRLTVSEWLHHACFISWVSLVSLGYRMLPSGLMERIRRMGKERAVNHEH